VRGRWSKADLWTATLEDGRRVVVKDFAGKPWPGWLLGRFQLRREKRAQWAGRAVRLSAGFWAGYPGG
jgi:hypothetical protein